MVVQFKERILSDAIWLLETCMNPNNTHVIDTRICETVHDTKGFCVSHNNGRSTYIYTVGNTICNNNTIV